MDLRLQLAAKCKGNMLGFYNVEDTCVIDEAVGGGVGQEKWVWHFNVHSARTNRTRNRWK